MANSILKQSTIYLDTFSSVIDFANVYPKGMKLNAIIWVVPTNVAHTFTILEGGASGTPIFEARCTTQNQGVVEYFHGAWKKPLYFAVAAGNEKASGKIIILLDMD
jgi:hypothetical protein